MYGPALTPGLTPTPAGAAAQTTSPWPFTLSSAGVRSGVRGGVASCRGVIQIILLIADESSPRLTSVRMSIHPEGRSLK